MTQKIKLLFVLWLAACLGSVRAQSTPVPSTSNDTQTPSATENPPVTSTSNETQTPSATENPPVTSTSNETQTPSATENPPVTSTSNETQTPSATENPPVTSTSNETQTPSATENPPVTSTSNETQTPSATENPPVTSTSNETQTPSATENPPVPTTSNETQTPSATENPPVPTTSNETQTPSATENPPVPTTSNETQTPSATENPPVPTTSNDTQTPSATENPPVTTTSNGTQTSTNPNEGFSTTSENPTSPPGPCEANVCGQGSTCQPRFNQSYVCLCLAGDSYSSISKSCVKAKVFPGQLNMPELQYQAQMSDTSSAEFLNGSEKIIDSLNNVFEGSAGYLGSTVLKLEENKPESRLWSRAESGVNATVDITFDPTADTTTEEVQQKIQNANCTDCPLAGATFTREDLCKKDDRYPCDETTTTCSPVDGSYNCSCNVGYLKTNFSDRMCIGCPGGQKVEDSQCVNCPFGYSGFNCTEKWKLILVIVGSVLGGLLLIMLILMPIVASISSKRSSKKNKKVDIGNPVLSQSAAEALLVKRGLAKSNIAVADGSNIAFHNGILPRIPRATTPRDRTNLEMTPRNSRQSLNPVGRNSQMYRDEDDTALYAQTLDGPQNNPYAMRRPQINPYASRQGQSNPSYIHDDGRGFNY